MLDSAEHSVLSRIEDTARFVASIVISNMAFSAGGTAPYSKEEWRRRTREFTIPQEAGRLLSAHSTIESSLKYLIKKTGRYYPRRHDLGILLGELMGCDPMAARSLCDAFDAAIEFYGTDTQDPDYSHLASLPDYLGKAATEEQFKLLRYFELESSIDNPALEHMYVEFHYEILRALGEILLPRYATIFDRVEEAARRAFLHSQRLDSLASHSKASKEAYTRWLEDQGTYLGALRKLGSRERPIGDDHADRVATSVCYELTGSEEIALRIVAHAQVSSKPIQHRDVETCIWRIKGSMNRIVTTPAKDPIGFARPLPTGFWVASDDTNDTHPSWFRHGVRRSAVFGQSVPNRAPHHHGPRFIVLPSSQQEIFARHPETSFTGTGLVQLGRVRNGHALAQDMEFPPRPTARRPHRGQHGCRRE